VRALLDAGAPANSVDPDGTTALTIAIINAHFDVAVLLIDRGADVNLADAAGMTPLYAAVDMQHQEPFIGRPLPKPSGGLGARDVIAKLVERGANVNALLRTPLLMRQHNTGDASLGEGATPLFRAAKVSDLDLMRLLLRHGADPKLQLRNGTTVLMNAVARAGRAAPPEQATIDAVALLLEHGADIQAANGNGQTALHAAVGRGDQVVRYLVERGARLDARDSFNRTPLDVAMGVPGGGRGRGGQPPGPGPVFKTTAALLKELAK
jgi:ankyrin repeat protein